MAFLAVAVAVLLAATIGLIWFVRLGPSAGGLSSVVLVFCGSPLRLPS